MRYFYLSLATLVIIASFFVKQSADEKFKANIGQESNFELEQTVNDLNKKDPVKAWAYVKKKLVVDNQVIANGHRFAHIIGNAIYDRYGIDGIRHCDDTFAFGCYHGVTERLLEKKGRRAVSQVEKRCLNIFPPEKSRNYTGCIHGMGHGLLAWESYNVQLALGDCDRLSTSYRPYCYDGVFMENSLEEKLITNNNRPWQFCEALEVRYQYNCARYQSHFFSNKFGNDLNKISQACLSTSKENLANPCLESLGYSVAQKAVGKSDVIKNECAVIDSEIGRNSCILGASREVIFQEYKDWQKTSIKLCDSLKNKWQDKCTKSLEQTKKIYQRE